MSILSIFIALIVTMLAFHFEAPLVLVALPSSIFAAIATNSLQQPVTIRWQNRDRKKSHPDATSHLSGRCQRNAVKSGTGVKSTATGHFQNQTAGLNSSDFCELVAEVVDAVAVDNENEKEVYCLSSDCCLTAHAGLGVTVRLPYTQNHPGLPSNSSRESHHGIEDDKLKMKQNQNTGAATAAVNITTKNVFAFKARPEIAPKGLLKASFKSLVNEVGGTGEDEFSRIIKEVELEATDKKGNRFVLTKEYNLLGRGATAFLEDHNAWSGASLMEDDLYDERDWNAMLAGKPVVVEVEHRKIGKQWEAYLKAFHPANTDAPVAS